MALIAASETTFPPHCDPFLAKLAHDFYAQLLASPIKASVCLRRVAPIPFGTTLIQALKGCRIPQPAAFFCSRPPRQARSADAGHFARFATTATRQFCAR